MGWSAAVVRAELGAAVRSACLNRAAALSTAPASFLGEQWFLHSTSLHTLPWEGNLEVQWKQMKNWGLPLGHVPPLQKATTSYITQSPPVTSPRAPRGFQVHDVPQLQEGPSNPVLQGVRSRSRKLMPLGPTQLPIGQKTKGRGLRQRRTRKCSPNLLPVLPLRAVRKGKEKQSTKWQKGKQHSKVTLETLHGTCVRAAQCTWQPAIPFPAGAS